MINFSGPLVTVIIPTYNRANQISRAIHSVQAQSYKHWELLIVDDASNDDTAKIISNIADSRIQYIRHETNQGAAAARNTALAQAKGEYIAFLDSDDEWIPAKLEKQVIYFEQLPASVGLIYTGALIVDSTEYKDKKMPVYRGNLLRQLLLENVIVGGGSSPMIRKAVLNSVASFDIKLPARQDLDFWVRISQHYLIDFIDEVLVIINASYQKDRITNNPSKRLDAWNLFLHKFEKEMINMDVLHIYLRDFGRLYQQLGDDQRIARQWYLKSIQVKPKSFFSYMLYLISFFPNSFYRLLADLYRKFRNKTSNNHRIGLGFHKLA